MPAVEAASARIHDGSPVMWTSEHSSAGTFMSSTAAAIVASSSLNGTPACGLRAITVETLSGVDIDLTPKPAVCDAIAHQECPIALCLDDAATMRVAARPGRDTDA